MENINIKINKKTRLVNLSKSVIGNDGENLQEKLVFSFDEFVDGTARLEISKTDNTKSYIMLTKVNNTYELPVKSIITKVGKLDMQLVITEGINENEIPIFKSNTFYVVVNSSINAEIEEPDEYAEWIDIANTKLNQIDNIDIDAAETLSGATITITKKDGTEEVVTLTNGINGTNGTNGIDGTDGVDGFSPIANVTKTRGGSAIISITDKSGTTTATVNDGEQGEPGQNGITPTIGNNGNWYLGETDTGKPSRGIQGETGQTGAPGSDGVDGISPTVTTSKSGNTTTITITDKNGDHTATILDGTNGTNGTNGTDGRDGYVQYTAGNNITIANNVISATGGTPTYEIPSTSSSSPFDFRTADPGIYVLKTTDIGQKFYYRQNDSSTQNINFQRIIMFVITKKTSDIVSQGTLGYYYYISTSNTATENGKYYYNSIEYNTSNSNISLGTAVNHGFVISASSQTFTGRKTFGNNPYVSSYTAPVQNYELAPKKYVDDSIATAITTTLGGSY